jgi:molecular chaperone GrpE (heat shock protein)
MFKKLITVGLVLLIAGVVTFGWVFAEKKEEQRRAAGYKLKYDSETNKYLKQYNQWLQLPAAEQAQLPSGLDEYGKNKTGTQLQLEQQERLKADMDKLAAGEIDVSRFADVLYGENWQDELAKYKRRKELSELVFSVSILCTLAGGAILSLSLSLLTVRRLIRSLSRITKFAATWLRGQEKTKAKQSAQADAKKKAKTRAKAEAEKLAKAEAKARAKAEAKEKVKAQAEARAKVKAERKAKTEADKLAKAEAKAGAKAEAKEKVEAEAEAKAKAKVKRKAEAKAEKLAKAEAKARAKAEAEAKARAETEERIRAQGQRSEVKSHSKVLRDSGWQGFGADSGSEAEEIGVLLSDGKSIELEESLKAVTENVNVSLKLKDSLKAQTENLEKQMAEFKQMAKSVRQAAVEQSEPINGTLTELTEQVAAIREYAASQQSRVEKLQDGYDWNIIKTFCLRVIRCIDNVENRIGRLTEQDIRAAHFEEIRDELIFALESSGVEQFRPEINSDYRGQEKYAEAVKGKESCKDPKQKSKIAKVIRPGYQYFISEENIKVVRPAQVKLFG